MEKYRTGTGQTILVHDPNPDCYAYGCSIHCPTQHSMSDFPTYWRDDRKLMERICPHGVGHPDPDHMSYLARTAGAEVASVEGVHGCDGCCH